MLFMICKFCKKEIVNVKGVIGYYLHSKQLVDSCKKVPFCSDECYQNYLNEYFVEEYKGSKIYKINKLGVKFYIPYAGANYGFKTLEACKNRIDSKNISMLNLTI